MQIRFSQTHENDKTQFYSVLGFSKTSWVLFEHFCSILLEKHEKEFEHEAFANTSICRLQIAQDLFNNFEYFTLSNIGFRGFPTTKGFKKIISLPKSTSIPKSNEKIMEMFQTYFNSKASYIVEIVKREQEFGKARIMDPNLIKIDDDDRSQSDDNDQKVQVLNNKENDSNEEFCKSSPISEQLFKEVGNSNTVSNTEISLKRKCDTDRQEETKHQKTGLTLSELKKRLNRDVIISLKKDMKNSIIIDTDVKDKEMTQTKKVLNNIQSLLDDCAPVYDMEWKIFQERQLKLLEEFNRLEEEMETNINTHLKQLVKFHEDSIQFTKEKEIEFSVLVVREEEDIEDYFNQIFKKQ